MIESKMEENKRVDQGFPQLMINQTKDMVILFYADGCGQVVHCCNSVYTVGQHSKTWYMPNFSDFRGTITLTA